MHFFIFFIFFLLLAVTITYFWHKAKTQHWQEVADKLGFQYTQDLSRSVRRMWGERDHYKVSVSTFAVGSGKNRSLYTRYRVEFQHPLGIDLRLSKEGLLSKVGSWFGFADLQIGDHEFDDAVKIEAKSESHVRGFLTASRKAQILHFLRSKNRAFLDDRGVEWSEAGNGDPNTFEDKIDRLRRFVLELEGAPDKKVKADEAVALRFHGDYDNALVNVRSALAFDKSPDPELRQLEGELLYTGGNYAEAAACFQDSRQSGIDPDGAAQWQELAKERERASKASAVPPEVSKSEPASSPEETELDVTSTDGCEETNIDMAAVANEFFGGSTLSFEVERIFKANYEGKMISWHGTLESVESKSYDFVFGTETHTKAGFLVMKIELSSYSTLPVKVFAKFPADAFASLEAQKGEQLRFRGILLRCDAFTRTFFLIDAEIV